MDVGSLSGSASDSCLASTAKPDSALRLAFTRSCSCCAVDVLDGEPEVRGNSTTQMYMSHRFVCFHPDQQRWSAQCITQLQLLCLLSGSNNGAATTCHLLLLLQLQLRRLYPAHTASPSSPTPLVVAQVTSPCVSTHMGPLAVWHPLLLCPARHSQRSGSSGVSIVGTPPPMMHRVPRVWAGLCSLEEAHAT